MNGSRFGRLGCLVWQQLCGLKGLAEVSVLVLRLFACDLLAKVMVRAGLMVLVV